MILGFYQDQKLAFEQVDKILGNSLVAKEDVEIPNLILEITRLFPVSPRCVEKRVHLFCEANHLKVVGRTVVMSK